MTDLKAVEIERFWSKVQPPESSGCWNWLSTVADNGYGRFSLGQGRKSNQNRSLLAHRLAYKMVVGDIPKNRQIDHLCRNRKCVNPYHMEIVTRKENILRGFSPAAINSRKTECQRGHVFTSTVRRINGSTFRRCKTCHAANARKYKKTKEL